MEVEVVARIEYTFALPSFWWVFPLIACLLGAMAVWKWRRHWRGLAAMGLLAIATANLMLWPLCWGRLLSVNFNSYTRHSVERWRSWRTAISIKYGAAHFIIEEYQFEKGIIPPPSPRLQVGSSAFVGPSSSGELYSMTKTSFLERVLGFRILWGREPEDLERGTTTALFGVTMPQWFIMLVCLPYPVLWFRRKFRRWHRVHHNLCLTCGFDLRAHKPGERCPECSTVIPGSHKGPQGAGLAGAGEQGEAKSAG